jgi:hypothetical protein
LKPRRKSVVAVQAILQEHNTKLIGLVNNAGLMKGAHMEICPMPWIRQMFDGMQSRSRGAATNSFFLHTVARG